MENKQKFRFILQILLLVSGISMLIIGLYNGEAREVLGKAVVICLECIGIN
jgi:hypothetical protein